MTYRELVPSSWLMRPEEVCIWATAYRVLGIPKETLTSGPKKVDFTQVRAVFLYGKLSYLEIGQVHQAKQFYAEIPETRMKETPVDVHLLLLTCVNTVDKYSSVGNKRASSAWKNISAVVALFAAFNEPDIVHEHIFDSVESPDGKPLYSLEVPRSPAYLTLPSINDSRLKIILNAEHAINNLPKSDQNRVHLSLNWYEMAIREETVTDAYLKYWLALEILAMPNTDIRPLNETLARAYSSCGTKEEYEKVKSKFKVGMLYGLRSDIVHNGKIVPARSDLLWYIDALCVDVLCGYLELPCQQRAIDVMEKPGFTLEEYFT